MRRITVLERADRIGGVWRDNTYPGAACDVPSSLYSFSFARNPRWRRRYAEQAEILGYLESVARRDDLLPLVRYGEEVVAAHYDEPGGRWRVETRAAAGERRGYEADLVVSAVGQLSRPHVPKLPGADSFVNPAFHSAAWDHRVDLAGRRVAVIGTGASAVQFVPHLQRVAHRVVVLQRSAPYVVPKPDRSYGRLRHRLYATAPPTQLFGRELTRILSEQLNRTFAGQTAMGTLLKAAWRLHLRRQVRDPALRAKLQPDYPLGCKRLLFSNDWYPALTRPNVEVCTEAIAEVTPEGVRTADGVLHEADVLVYATGFWATDFLEPIRLTGRAGQTLAAEWVDGAHAYLGMTVPGFPNLFLLYGPNTNLGGSSILSMIECQTHYLGQAADLLASGTARSLEVRRDVADRYDGALQRRLRDTVWSAGCSNWYRDDDGRVTTNWPGQVREYRARTAQFDPADYVVSAMGTTLDDTKERQ